jgi:hypothetical protein
MEPLATLDFLLQDGLGALNVATSGPIGIRALREVSAALPTDAALLSAVTRPCVEALKGAGYDIHYNTEEVLR